MIIGEIRRHSAGFAELPAVIDSRGTLTHSDLWNRVDRLTRSLIAAGLGRGRVLLAWLPDCREAIEAELACLQAGAVWVSVNTRFTWPEVDGIICDCEPAMIVTDAAHRARIPEDAWLRLAESPLFVTGGREAGIEAPARCWESEIAAADPGPQEIPIATTDIARLRYTSGTTGRPKAAVLPYRVYLASLRNLQTTLHPMDTTDRVLHAAPLTHAGGALVFPVLAAGGANVIPGPFDAERALDAIERERITTMFLVPTILQRLTEAASFPTRDLSSLRSAIYGGAPIAPEKLAPAIARMGHALVHIYGMTEAPWPIAALPPSEHYPGGPKLGSIGRPTAVCEIELRDESGRVCGPDETGEIRIRGENVMDGYWKDEAETRRALRDGWLRSGDLARRDRDGYYWIVDRIKDVIISGGFNVYAREVEAVLTAHEGVLEAAVIGEKHPDWGETVAAYVVTRAGAGPTEEELAQWCRERLSTYKRPRRIEQVPELPRNSSGKIAKSMLGEISRARPTTPR